MTTLQDQLRKHVRAAGLQETARRTGINAGHLSSWCSGTKGMGGDNLDRIAQALKLRVMIKSK